MKREALGAGGVAAHFSKSARSGAPPGCIIQLSKTNGVIIATPEKVATRQGVNIFNHITVQVDNTQEVGFAPKNPTALQEFEMVKNNIQFPGYIEPRAAGLTTKDAVTIYLTQNEANNAQQTITDWTNNPGYYQFLGRSCVDFADVVISSTGFIPPNDVTPDNAIKQIRAQQIIQNKTQAP
jgi:hypothetical protein